MKNTESWEVKALTYNKPGVGTWETIRTFTNPAEADNWLMNYIRENHLIPTDYTIASR